jgi:hypothetical protein
MIHNAWKPFDMPFSKLIDFRPAPSSNNTPKRDQHAALYIGKMSKGKEEIYSKETLE